MSKNKNKQPKQPKQSKQPKQPKQPKQQGSHNDQNVSKETEIIKKDNIAYEYNELFYSDCHPKSGSTTFEDVGTLKLRMINFNFNYERLRSFLMEIGNQIVERGNNTRCYEIENGNTFVIFEMIYK